MKWSLFKKFIWAAVLFELIGGIVVAYLIVKYIAPWVVEFLRLNGVRFPS